MFALGKLITWLIKRVSKPELHILILLYRQWMDTGVWNYQEEPHAWTRMWSELQKRTGNMTALVADEKTGRRRGKVGRDFQTQGWK